MFRLSPRGFLGADGAETGTIRTSDATAGSAQWVERQDAALPEYDAELDAVPEETQRLYEMFSSYIARALLGGTRRRILDVGCGIGSRLPPYVRPLQSGLADRAIAYFGLDPLERNLSGRDYPFICGRLEDLPGVLADRFDVFLFATSLDHFEDTARAAAAVRRLSAPGAQCVFWLGLHDPELVAEDMGRRQFVHLGSSLHPIVYFWRAARVTAAMLRRYPDLVARAWRLKRGVPLDALHFAYFTRANVRQHLEQFGEVCDFLQVPGTNSAFATVATSASAAR